VKLLHVAASYLPATRYGGTIVSVHGLTRALAARGHEVHVFTTSVDGPDDSDVPHGVPVDLDGVKVRYFRSERLRRIYFSPTLADALRSECSTFDVLHTHAMFLYPLWAAARLARRYDRPYVVSTRGMLERDLIAARSPLLKALWIAAIERHNLEGASAIHVTSAREADEIARFGFNLPAMFEIPNGVDVNPRTTGEPSPSIAALLGGEPYVLFLGRINWKKGLDRLIAAMSRLPRARLVVAGNDEDGYEKTVRELTARAGITDRVTFAGEVQERDKAALLAGARVLVVPSYSENFGNVVLEAMAAGCPVITTPEVGAAPIVEASGAGRVVSGEPATLSEAIAQLVDAPRSVRDEMADRGRAAVRASFSWDAVAARMEDVYASIQAGGRQH
jgi:glycosyltransferase involved in cell wall biosynthesis